MALSAKRGEDVKRPEINSPASPCGLNNSQGEGVLCAFVESAASENAKHKVVLSVNCAGEKGK